MTPFKNTASFLDDCIQSVINQSYTHWEFLLVDDHSTDNSAAIVESYAAKDSRIKLLKNKDSGIISALQKAFANSKGEYITRMDSDDIMHPDKLSVLLNNLISNGKHHVAVGQVMYFSEVGISNGYAKYESWLNALTQTGNNYTEIYKECVIPSPCWMIHREDLIACDAFNPNRYPEDYDLTFRFYLHKFRCIPCSKILHYWRDYPTRTSRTSVHYAQNYFLEIKLYYFLKLDHLPEQPLCVWGAGYKGKEIAKQLIKKNIPFYWLCDNPKKIGKRIYNQLLLHYSKISQLQEPQSIITVANTSSQKEIISYLEGNNGSTKIDYYFFC